ncbi:hypothetical protein ABPG74_012885 [Tetrahymena malaccensis]
MQFYNPNSSSSASKNSNIKVQQNLNNSQLNNALSPKKYKQKNISLDLGSRKISPLDNSLRKRIEYQRDSKQSIKQPKLTLNTSTHNNTCNLSNNQSFVQSTKHYQGNSSIHITGEKTLTQPNANPSGGLNGNIASNANNSNSLIINHILDSTKSQGGTININANNISFHNQYNITNLVSQMNRKRQPIGGNVIVNNSVGQNTSVQNNINQLSANVQNLNNILNYQHSGASTATNSNAPRSIQFHQYGAPNSTNKVNNSFNQFSQSGTTNNFMNLSSVSTSQNAQVNNSQHINNNQGGNNGSNPIRRSKYKINTETINTQNDYSLTIDHSGGSIPRYPQTETHKTGTKEIIIPQSNKIEQISNRYNLTSTNKPNSRMHLMIGTENDQSQNQMGGLKDFLSPQGAAFLKQNVSSKSTQRNYSNKNRYLGLNKMQVQQQNSSQSRVRSNIKQMSKDKALSVDKNSNYINRRDSTQNQNGNYGQDKSSLLQTLQPPASQSYDQGGDNSYYKHNTLQDEQLGSTYYTIDNQNLQQPTIQSSGSSKLEEKMLTWEDLKLPVGPDDVLNKYGHEFLTDYEKKEILQYMNIYYVGHKAKKPARSEIQQANQYNFGYDDEKGDYLYTLNDHIAYRYELIEALGKGSFGQVIKVFDHKRKEYSALKIIRNKKNFYNQAIVELNILKYIKDNDPQNQTNIVKIKDFVIFRSHVCIVFELLSINLYEFLKNNKFNGVSLELIRRFAIQILQGLLFLTKANIIHCDLKPENILLKQENKSGIKIVDFGSSCFENQRVYTYIQSRFYRAPEIILGLPYGKAIDMWSFGCIMAELYIGYPLFPGENEAEQFQMFMEVLGVPEEEFVENCPRRNVFFENNKTPKVVKNSRGKIRTPSTKHINYYLRCPDENFIDFVSKCFTWKNHERMSPAEALVHDWILEGLPEEIRAQHLQQMQQTSPEIDMRAKFKKYKIAWIPPPNLQVFKGKIPSAPPQQQYSNKQAKSQSSNKANTIEDQPQNNENTSGVGQGRNSFKKAEMNNSSSFGPSVVSVNTGLQERNKNIINSQSHQIQDVKINPQSQASNPSSSSCQNAINKYGYNQNNGKNFVFKNQNPLSTVTNNQPLSHSKIEQAENPSSNNLAQIPLNQGISLQNNKKKTDMIHLSDFNPYESDQFSNTFQAATTTNAKKTQQQFGFAQNNTPQHQNLNGIKANNFLQQGNAQNQSIYPNQIKIRRPDSSKKNKIEQNIVANEDLQKNQNLQIQSGEN